MHGLETIIRLNREASSWNRTQPEERTPARIANGTLDQLQLSLRSVAVHLERHCVGLEELKNDLLEILGSHLERACGGSTCPYPNCGDSRPASEEPGSRDEQRSEEVAQ